MKNVKKLSLSVLFSVVAAIHLPGCSTQQVRGPTVLPDAPAPTEQGPTPPPESATSLPPAQLPLASLAPQAANATVKPSEPTEPPVIWDRIRSGMLIGDRDHDAVTAEIGWFQNHQEYLDRVMERARPYMHFIVDEVKQRQMPMELALLPVVESAFQPFAYSQGRAAGIWQFIPGTGRRFGLKQTWWYDGRRDIASSTRAALDYLQALHQDFGDWELALAAYNSGEGTVARAIRHNERKGEPTDFWSLDLPRETRGYVPKLLAISAIVDNPQAYGIDLKPIPDAPFLTSVDVGSQIDLDLAAELAGIDIEDMYRYNPAFNRWATDPDGPHTLLVPIEKADQFRERIAELPKEERIQWVHHVVHKGESLGSIATHYRTTVALVRSVNSLKGHFIRVGSTLVIPVARKKIERYTLSADQRLASLQDTPRTGERKEEYTVHRGETLWSIANAHDVSVDELAKWNGMAPRDPLVAGRKLVLWDQEEPQLEGLTRVRLTPVSFVHPASEELHRRISYNVRSGDNLSSIARKFRVSVSDLKHWNRIGRRNRLRRGQKLTVYVDITRQSGNI